MFACIYIFYLPLSSGYPTNQSFDTFVGQDTQVGCHDWYPQTVCNNSVHNAALNTPAELDYTTCLGPDSKCTWANDLDKTAALEFIAEAKVHYYYFVPAFFFLGGGGGLVARFHQRRCCIAEERGLRHAVR